MTRAVILKINEFIELMLTQIARDLQDITPILLFSTVKRNDRIDIRTFLQQNTGLRPTRQ